MKGFLVFLPQPLSLVLLHTSVLVFGLGGIIKDRAQNLDSEIAKISKSTRTRFSRLQPLHEVCRQHVGWYYRWHLNAYSSKIHFIILAFYLGITVGLSYSLMYLAQKSALAAPATVDTSSSSSATYYSFQRKTFYDSTNSNYWAFYWNGSAIEYSYSADGTSWTSAGTVVASIPDFAIWNNGNTVYLAYATGTGSFCSYPCGSSLKARKGTISSNNISFEAENTVESTEARYAGLSISQDSNNKIWIAWDDGFSNAHVYAIRSQSANDVSLWDAYTEWADSSRWSVIVPLNSGQMYVLFVGWPGTNQGLQGRLYNGSSWGNLTFIQSGSYLGKVAALSYNGEIHMIFVDSNGVRYKKYSGSWGATVTLDSNSTNDSPSITVNANGDLWVFWTRSNTVYYKKGVSPYASVNWDANSTALYSTGTNTNVNAAYNTTGTKVFLEWTNGSGSPYSIYFDNSVSVVASITRYWIDTDGGNWNDTANWSATSGGAGGASVPVAGETAIFDNAGGTRNGALTIDTAVSVGILTFDTNYSGTITQGANTITVLNAMTLTGTSLTAGADITNGHLVIASGKILDINGHNLTVTGAVANDGTLKLQGGETLSLTNDTDSGTVEYNGTGGPYTIRNWTYYHLKINSSGKTFNLPAAITINGDLTISAGILDSNTYDFSVKGSWTNNDTFNAGSKTVNFTSTTSGKTINPGASSFYDLNFNGSGGAWSPLTNTVTVTNNLTMTSGTFNTATGTANVTVNGNIACGVSSCSTISMTSTNTFTQNVSSNKNFGTSIAVGVAWSFYNLTFSSSSGTPTITTSTIGTGSITIAQTLTIAVNTTLNAGNRTWILTGAIASPFSYSGTLTPASSTFQYNNVNAAGNVNITTAPYFKLTLTPASAETYDLGGNLSGANAITGILTLSSTNVTFDPKTYDLTVTGAFSSTAGNFGITGTKPSGVHIFSSTWTNNAGATFYLSSNATATVITGNISGTGTLNATSNGSLTVNGTTVSFAGGTFTKGTGTFKFNKGSTQTFTPSASNFGNVQISTASTHVDISNTLTLNALTIDASTTLDDSSGNYAINVASNWTNNGGIFTPGSSTVTFNGIGAQAIGGSTATTFNAVTVSNTSAVLTVSTNMSASGDLTINASAVLTPAATVIISGTGTLTGAGTAQVTRTAATPDFSSQYTITNKALTNLTVEYTAASAQTVSTVAYGHLKISTTASAVATLAAATTLTGNLTISSGGTLSAGSNYALNVGGNWTNGASGVFTSGTNTVTLNGSGVQSVTAGGTDASHDFYNLTITNSAGPANGVTFADSLTVTTGTFTDITPNSKLTFADGATYTLANININGDGTGDVTMTKGAGAHGHWHFIVPGTPAVTYVTVDNSDATGSGTQIDATINCHDGTGNTYWNFGGSAPVNDSLTFTNPYSGNVAVSDDTTAWTFRALVTDADGPTDINYVEIRFANSTDNVQPYDSLKFRWTEATDVFSEEADTQTAAAITSTGVDSNASGNQWTLDFKIKFNSSFTTKDTQYNIELYAIDDASAPDNDDYVNKYQVTQLTLSLGVDSPTIAFGNLLPGTVITDTTITTVTTNYGNGYTLAAQDDVAGSDSVLLHTDTTTRIADYSGTIAVPTLWSGTGLGISVYQATGKEAKWGTGTTETDSNNKYAGIPQNATEIHAKTGSPTTGDTTYVGYKLVVPNSQKTGDYSGVLTYTATGVLN